MNTEKICVMPYSQINELLMKPRIQSMKFTFKQMASGLIIVIGWFYLSGCQTDWYSKTSLELAKHPQKSRDNISRGVDEMWRAYGPDMDCGKVERSNEIPPQYWNSAIKALHPIRVYCDAGNFVVV